MDRPQPGPAALHASRYRILIVYANFSFPLRSTVTSHLYALRDYTPHRCLYLNALYTPVLPAFMRAGFDLIVFDTTFLAMRLNYRDTFLALQERLSLLKELDCPKVMLPQDEYQHTDVLGQFINDFGITHVFSVIPASEWPKIYPDTDLEENQFSQVLTGYLDSFKQANIQRLQREISVRDLDLGYRAWKAPAWLGWHGLLKLRIAEVFEPAAKKVGLKTDISCRPEDTLLGDDWFRFLLRCKYTLGTEGGATVHDVDGQIRQRTDAYIAECQARGHDPDFAEIEEACFPGRDGEIHVIALSPRHLEACATRTCQVLLEGDYNGILEPGRHYLPVKPDFSNLDEILDTIKRDDIREEIIETAYQDIVASGRYTYRSFVDNLLSHSLKNSLPHSAQWQTEFVFAYGQMMEVLTWFRIRLRAWLLRRLSANTSQRLRHLKQRLKVMGR